jgi:hypothetical protein
MSERERKYTIEDVFYFEAMLAKKYPQNSGRVKTIREMAPELREYGLIGRDVTDEDLLRLEEEARRLVWQEDSRKEEAGEE